MLTYIIVCADENGEKHSLILCAEKLELAIDKLHKDYSGTFEKIISITEV